MAALRLLLLLLCLAAPAWAGAPLLEPEILAELPHDPAAFTQGLLAHQGLLYESVGKYGRSEVRAVEPDTGRVLRRTKLAAKYFAEGLALVQGRLALLTWQEHVGFFLGLPDLKIEGSFPWQGEGWGLAAGGGQVLASDGSSRLRILDPGSMLPTGLVEVRDGDAPVREVNELEFVNGLLWANIWMSDRVAVLDPGTGRVRAWLDLTPLRARLTNPTAEAANGLAFDPGSGRLYATGKFWDKLFVLGLPRLP
jgi:glutamine cyclotransferase